MNYLHIKLFFLLMTVLLSCNNKEDIVPVEEIVKKEPITGTRIAWDYSSLQKLIPQQGRNIGGAGYSRMIELANGDYLCVYEVDLSTEMIRSIDKGKTWADPVIIAQKSNNIAMAVPEIIQLSNEDIIISYNPRPLEPYTSDRHFSIAIKRSSDNGSTWSTENLIYEAGTTFETGCWEPNIIELPSGELQLYFANEADYTSHEQNISMFRSNDKGQTWGNREIVSFSPTSRDGMPVAIYLDETNEIIFSIEDNYQYNFKPAIIRSSDNWSSGTVGRNNPNRYYALNHDQRSAAYQGAPYIRKMLSNNIVISYQGTEDRGGNNDMGNSTMYVETGDKTGRNFKNKTEPFDVPLGKFALWNSLSVMDGKVWAIASTNAYSLGVGEVWTISGYEVNDYKIPKGKITISTAPYPFFVGHIGETNANVKLGYDDSNIYLNATVKDKSVFNKDGVTFSIDPQNISSEAPASGIFAFTVTADGEIISKEGFNGKWEQTDLTTTDLSVNKTDEGYEINLSIAWVTIGGKPNTEERIGFTISLLEYETANRISYTENLVLCYENEPYTWTTIKL